MWSDTPHSSPRPTTTHIHTHTFPPLGCQPYSDQRAKQLSAPVLLAALCRLPALTTPPPAPSGRAGRRQANGRALSAGPPGRVDRSVPGRAGPGHRGGGGRYRSARSPTKSSSPIAPLSSPSVRSFVRPCPSVSIRVHPFVRSFPAAKTSLLQQRRRNDVFPGRAQGATTRPASCRSACPPRQTCSRATVSGLCCHNHTAPFRSL